MKKVFLGGTCGKTTWRNTLIELLKIDYFNPVVDDWTEDCQKEELKQRELCDFCLYTITPDMEGFYSIAEMVDDSNKRPEKCVVCFLTIGETYKNCFTKSQLYSIKAIKNMITKNGSKVFGSLDEVADYLNKA
jgi:hypothetical protein